MRQIFTNLSKSNLVDRHYLIIALAVMIISIYAPFVSAGEIEKDNKTIIEPLPILTYSSDIGFGYGLKLFLLNSLHKSESFDLLLFRSTRDQQLYRLVFSIPDFEKRQGTVYKSSLDIWLNYDKWVKRYYYGTGSESSIIDPETYTFELSECKITYSRGFTPHHVIQLGIHAQSVENSNFEENSLLYFSPNNLNRTRVSCLSAFTVLRHDTRDSYINPGRGIVIQAEIESAPRVDINDVAFTRQALWFQYYRRILHKTVLSARLGWENLSGTNLPIQVLLRLGSHKTLRGYPQDRFLEKTMGILNAELRYPIYKRLGGVVGFDTGKVWDSPGSVDFKNWASSVDLGLRYYFQTFIVRFDYGISRESSGIYFQFGHIF